MVLSKLCFYSQMGLSSFASSVCIASLNSSFSSLISPWTFYPPRLTAVLSEEWTDNSRYTGGFRSVQCTCNEVSALSTVYSIVR